MSLFVCFKEDTTVHFNEERGSIRLRFYLPSLYFVFYERYAIVCKRNVVEFQINVLQNKIIHLKTEVKTLTTLVIVPNLNIIINI